MNEYIQGLIQRLGDTSVKKEKKEVVRLLTIELDTCRRIVAEHTNRQVRSGVSHASLCENEIVIITRIEKILSKLK